MRAQFLVLALGLVVLAPSLQAQDDPANWLTHSMVFANDRDSIKAEYTLDMQNKTSGETTTFNGKLYLRGEKDMLFEMGEESPDLRILTGESGGILHVPQNNRYFEIDKPRLDLLAGVGSQATNMVFKWLAGYLANNATILKESTDVEFIEQAEIGGRPVNHIQLKYPVHTIDAWIADDDKPMLLRLDFDFPEGPNLPRNSLRFKSLETDVAVEDAHFAMDTATTEKAASIQELFRPVEKVKVGMKAPAFTLEKLGGGKVSLADHQGKQVVLLDFFASWCGPCRMGMPVIDELAKEYADADIAFYAVNLEEGADAAQKFIRESGIKNLGVALDLSGKVGREYEAFSIPRTVIVGKDGTVKAIHRGFSPNLKEDLKKDLDAILKGETPSS